MLCGPRRVWLECMFPLGSCRGYKGLLKIASLDEAAEFFRFSTRIPSILPRVENAKCKWCTQISTSRGPLRNPLCLWFPNQLQPVKCGVAPTQESNLITTYGSKARLANRVKENLALYGRLHDLLNTTLRDWSWRQGYSPMQLMVTSLVELLSRQG